MTTQRIKNINKTNWFKTMDYYPKTIEQIKLLISIVDKISIFESFDLDKIIEMESDKLDILYAVIRIMNKVFNRYLDFAVKKIFRNGLKQLFSCTDLTYYDLFFDQLTQDIDNFVCVTIKQHYPIMNALDIKNNFIKYLESIFSKNFYQKLIKKLSYDVDNNFYKKHNDLFKKMTQEFISHTNDTLHETYETMKIFLDKIFNPQCSVETINEIISTLKNNMDLKILFEEKSMEISIYIESAISLTQNLCSESPPDFQTKKSDISQALQKLSRFSKTETEISTNN